MAWHLDGAALPRRRPAKHVTANATRPRRTVRSTQLRRESNATTRTHARSPASLYYIRSIVHRPHCATVKTVLSGRTRCPGTYVSYVMYIPNFFVCIIHLGKLLVLLQLLCSMHYVKVLTTTVIMNKIDTIVTITYRPNNLRCVTLYGSYVTRYKRCKE